MGQNMWGYRCALAAIASLALATPLRAEDDAAFESTEPKTESKSHSSAESALRIEAVLDRPLRAPLDFVETPLNQIANVLAEDYDIPILFDTAALDAVASSPEVEATVSIANVSLRSALDLMLRNAGAEDLTYVVDDEVLLITTQEEAEKRLEVRVYRVDDLNVSKPWPYPGATAYADFNSLIDLIASCVERESWMENGTGEGEIQPYGDGLIVISQTRRVHDQVAQLLDAIRRNLDAIDADAAKDPATANQPITRGIRIADDIVAEPSETRAAIANMLLKSVAWQTDDAELADAEVFLRFEGNRIYVRHRPQVVKQVEEAMKGMGIIAPYHQPLASGGYGGEDKKKSKPNGGGGF